MVLYQVKSGYLNLFKLPNEFSAIPTFKEEKIRLSQEEAEFLVAALKNYREGKPDSDR